MPDLMRPISLLIADDDQEDCLLTRKALEAARLHNQLEFVADGVYLMQRLQLSLQNPEMALPDLILLDLNMPRMDGRSALQAIRNHPQLRHLPVVVLTTSREEEDVFRSYDLGANSFITKPVLFDNLVAAMQSLGHYWLSIVQLPKHPVT